MLEFRYPYFLILLIPCLLMIGLYFKRSPMRRHTVVIGLLRTLVFTFLVFSLATPTLLLPSGHKQVVFLIDHRDHLLKRKRKSSIGSRQVFVKKDQAMNLPSLPLALKHKLFSHFQKRMP